MALKVRNIGNNKDIGVIDLEGRMDYHFVCEKEKEIEELVKNNHYRIILNLANLSYISSSGLRLFLNILKEVKRYGGELKLVKMQRGVMKVLEIAELTELFEIFEEEEEAMIDFNQRKKVKLQLALDVGSQEKVLHIANETSPYVDCIECGTPLIKNLGMQIVSRMRQEFPDKIIFADLKIMDVGAYEAGCAFDAGADIVSVCAAAPDVTIAETAKAGSIYKKRVVADLIGVKDKIGRVKEIESLGIDIICVHVGIDEQAQGKDPLDVFKSISSVTNLSLMVAGGINLERLTQLIPFSPEFVVVGGAITNADDPKEAAKILKEKIMVALS